MLPIVAGITSWKLWFSVLHYFCRQRVQFCLSSFISPEIRHTLFNVIWLNPSEQEDMFTLSFLQEDVMTKTSMTMCHRRLTMKTNFAVLDLRKMYTESNDIFKLNNLLEMWVNTFCHSKLNRPISYSWKKERLSRNDHSLYALTGYCTKQL